jgi:hypothetical protein
MIEIICRSRAMKGTRLVVPVCGTVARNNYQMDGMSWDGFRLIRFGLRQNVISEAKREEFRGWANLVRQHALTGATMLGNHKASMKDPSKVWII